MRIPLPRTLDPRQSEADTKGLGLTTPSITAPIADDTATVVELNGTEHRVLQEWDVAEAKRGESDLIFLRRDSEVRVLAGDREGRVHEVRGYPSAILDEIRSGRFGSIRKQQRRLHGELQGRQHPIEGRLRHSSHAGGVGAAVVAGCHELIDRGQLLGIHDGGAPAHLPLGLALAASSPARVRCTMVSRSSCGAARHPALRCQCSPCSSVRVPVPLPNRPRHALYAEVESRTDTLRRYTWRTCASFPMGASSRTTEVPPVTPRVTGWSGTSHDSTTWRRSSPMVASSVMTT